MIANIWLTASSGVLKLFEVSKMISARSASNAQIANQTCQKDSWTTAQYHIDVIWKPRPGINPKNIEIVLMINAMMTSNTQSFKNANLTTKKSVVQQSIKIAVT